MGALLGMGSERDLGPDYHTGLRIHCSYAPVSRDEREFCLQCCCVCGVFLGIDDLLRGELFPWRNSLLCRGISFYPALVLLCNRTGTYRFLYHRIPEAASLSS